MHAEAEASPRRRPAAARQKKKQRQGFGHDCAASGSAKTPLLGPLSAPFLPFSAVCDLFLPLSALSCLFHALCASRSMPCVPARARRKKKTG
jgi:hypothetical protein